MADIVQIFKKVQMVRIHIQNQLDARIKFEKAVGVFAGFGDKILGAADTDIAVNIL